MLKTWQGMLTEYELEQVIHYSSFDATQKYQSSFEEIVRHVINHGSYHRRQIAMMLRLLGRVPPSSDWIIYSREHHKIP
jgi:uncharacterized damage-inducible protein DinB